MAKYRNAGSDSGVCSVASVCDSIISEAAIVMNFDYLFIIQINRLTKDVKELSEKIDNINTEIEELKKEIESLKG